MAQTQTTVASTEYRPAAARAARPWASPRYYWCVAILAASALSMQGMAAWFDNYFRKLELPLKRHLYELRPELLEPEYVRHVRQPPPLAAEELENLGTDELLNWLLLDTSKAPDDPTRMVHLFITYYTGKPDMVPHEPRECRGAAGQRLLDEDTAFVTIDRPDGSAAQIKLAVLDFELPPRGDQVGAGTGRQTVLFFFWANGRYVTTRNDVRIAVANLRHRYAYYTKFEMFFSNETRTQFAGREESVAAGAALLRKLMPPLWRDHYQDWDAIVAGQPPQRPSP